MNKRALGARALLDVILLDATLVRGSHGRITYDVADGPVLISSEAGLLPDGNIEAVDVKALILAHLFESVGETARQTVALESAP